MVCWSQLGSLLPDGIPPEGSDPSSTSDHHSLCAERMVRRHAEKNRALSTSCGRSTHAKSTSSPRSLQARSRCARWLAKKSTKTSGIKQLGLSHVSCPCISNISNLYDYRLGKSEKIIKKSCILVAASWLSWVCMCSFLAGIAFYWLCLVPTDMLASLSRCSCCTKAPFGTLKVRVRCTSGLAT